MQEEGRGAEEQLPADKDAAKDAAAAAAVLNQECIISGLITYPHVDRDSNCEIKTNL